MDGSSFSNAPFSFIFGIPGLILILIGLLTIVGGLGFGLWWIIHHLQWVW